MTKYRVLKPMPRATVGAILSDDRRLDLLFDGDDRVVIHQNVVDAALEQGFIEEIKEEWRWRAEALQPYWFIYTDGIPTNSTEHGMSGDNSKYELGNYFKSEATSQLVAEAQKLMYEYLHTEPGTPQQNIKNQFEKAHAEARKAVLADDRSEA